MAKRPTKPPMICSFCGNSHNGLIKGVSNDAHICEQCVQLCSDMTRKKKVSPEFEESVPTPKELVEHLNKFIIGQDKTKKILSVAVSNHYKRLKDNQARLLGNSLVTDEALQNVVLEKSNILLLGPTGCGKTLMAKCLADRLSVPLAIGDATTLTEAGYVGEDVENLLVKLLMKADYDLDLAQRGIIFIDEIDKIGKTNGNVSITRDVSGEGVQQGLLKIIEGTIANVPPAGGRKHPEQQYIQFDTSNVLFICGGSFVGLADIICKRTGGGVIGFGAEPKKENDLKKLLPQVEVEDLEQFGLIPELIGRLPILAPLEELSEEDMIRILTEPENAILKQYQKQFAMDGAKLSFTKGAVREIAKIAKLKKTGARALRSVVEGFMLDIMFEMSDLLHKEFLIDVDVVRGNKSLLPQKEAA
jgi:ATP-dependent Clp protease ATP-binding subunit ClpX